MLYRLETARRDAHEAKLDSGQNSRLRGLFSCRGDQHLARADAHPTNSNVIANFLMPLTAADCIDEKVPSADSCGQAHDDKLTEIEQAEDDLKDKEVWLSKANNNTQVKKAKSNLELSKYDKEIQQSARYPTLSLGVSATYFERYGLVPSHSEDLKVSLELDFPIFSGGATSSKVRQSKTNIVRATFEYRNALDLTRLNIDNALDNLQHDKSYINSLYAALESSEILLATTKKMHTMGLQSLIDVTHMRAQHKMAENAFLEALYGATLHRLELLRLTGSLTELDLTIIDNALTLTNNKEI